MNDAETLRSALPANHVENTFTSWAALREYSIEKDADTGCLTILRLDSENLHETIAVQPDPALFQTLVQSVHDPTLRMLTVLTPVDAVVDYAAMAKAQGAKFADDGGKIMAARLSAAASSPEDALAAVDPALVAHHTERMVQIQAGERVVATGKVSVQDGVATFDGIFTEPEFQRRGLATCVMGFLVRMARDGGAEMGMLNASPLGQLMYGKLGWTAVYHVVSIGGEPLLGFLERMRQKYAPKKEGASSGAD